MWPFRHLRRRALLRKELIPDDPWRRMFHKNPLFAGLPNPEENRLRELSTLFIHEKHIVPASGFQVDDDVRLSIALQACLPILNLGLDWYEDWSTIIVYPGLFRHRRMHQDDAGVIHARDETLSGEAWEIGPVVLSSADVDLSGRMDGYNVVIHEMAHKLDMLNGSANGFPPLHRGMDPQLWTSVFSTAFESLLASLRAGQAAPPLDPYAAESPDEFFAVLSEYFFEVPQHIVTHYPEVYRQLCRFYRQDPAQRQATKREAPDVHSSLRAPH